VAVGQTPLKKQQKNKSKGKAYGCGSCTLHIVLPLTLNANSRSRDCDAFYLSFVPKKIEQKPYAREKSKQNERSGWFVLLKKKSLPNHLLR
jgi:hypothetical protein